MRRVKLVKLSVCDCGFPLLDESIPLGTEYTIEETNHGSFTITCGGCGKDIPLKGVWVHKRGQSHGGYLPAEVFEEL